MNAELTFAPPTAISTPSTRAGIRGEETPVAALRRFALRQYAEPADVSIRNYEEKPHLADPTSRMPPISEKLYVDRLWLPAEAPHVDTRRAHKPILVIDVRTEVEIERGRLSSGPMALVDEGPIIRSEVLGESTAAGVTSSLRWLRVGFATLVVLLNAGLLLASFAIATNAGPLVRGLAVTSMWAGMAAVTVAAHIDGRWFGTRLLSRQLSLLAMVIAVGMTVVALVATIEFSLR